MWFGVSLLFKSIHANEPEEEPLWEERIILLQAPSEAEARPEAERIGQSAEQEYLAADGQAVRWKFVQIERAYPIPSDALETGTEVFSRFLRTSEVESLLTPFED
jgi:hypothetical protein